MPSSARHARSARTDSNSLSISTPSQSKMMRSKGIASRRRRHAGPRQRRLLALGEYALVEIVDQLVKQPVPVDLGLQMEEHRTEADRGAVHEDKGARGRDAAEPADVAVDVVDEAAPISIKVGGAGLGLLLDHPRPVVEQRAVDKGGPAVQHLDHLVRQLAETPAAVGLDREFAVVALQGVIEVD